MATQATPDMRDAEMGGAPVTAERPIVIPAGSERLDVAKTRPYVSYISNVVYAQVPSRGYESVPLRMDILRPQAKAPMPAIVYVTGGGFINANKDSYLQQRMDLAEAGYVVASIEYRVAPTAIFSRSRSRTSRRPCAICARTRRSSASIPPTSASSAAPRAAISPR